jgi:hypothetical protein
VPVWLLITLERVLARLVLHKRTVRSLEADAIRLPAGATATLFMLPSCSLKRYALRFALKFQSMRQSSSPPLTICFMLGKNAALLMAERWPRKVRSRVGSMGMAGRDSNQQVVLNSAVCDGDTFLAKFSNKGRGHVGRVHCSEVVGSAVRNRSACSRHSTAGVWGGGGFSKNTSLLRGC